MSGDQARVSVSVAVPIERAFELFTDDIDRWWRRGPKYRHIGAGGIMRIEPAVGGRVLESGPGGGASSGFVIGTVRVWEPPHRLAFSWRNVNFGPNEVTEVELEFAAAEGGTMVTVTHRGLAALPDDHPARHGATGPEFSRMIGMWWGDQMTSLRESARPTG